jgi:putative tryptophan/tyrosine transport system substrate-binding protein
VRRRQFVAFLGTIVAWPSAVSAQQQSQPRLVGVLTNLAADDQEGQARIAAFVQALERRGWVDGRNIHIERRWAGGNPERIRSFTAELIALGPEVILATGSATVTPLLEATRSIPIVFVNVPDPVGSRVVASMGQPGGNVTGFTPYDYTTSGKWLDLLKQLLPSLAQAGLIRDPAEPAVTGQTIAIQSAAASLGVELSLIDVHDRSGIGERLAAFASKPDRGLIVLVGASPSIHRDFIISEVARLQLPTVYPYRHYAVRGGLMSYGPDLLDQYDGAAGYFDRILKGDKPHDLPVQAPTRYQLVVNLRTARALGFSIPNALLARADEVIE